MHQRKYFTSNLFINEIFSFEKFPRTAFIIYLIRWGMLRFAQLINTHLWSTPCKRFNLHMHVSACMADIMIIEIKNMEVLNINEL